MNAVMYIFLNRGLGMSTGKAAAQAAHAGVQGFQLSKGKLVDAWMSGKHYTKLVMLARDEQHIQTIQDYLADRGFKTEMIIDEGMTEVDPHVKTALAVEIVDKDDAHVTDTFSSFALYRDTVRVTLEIDR